MAGDVLVYRCAAFCPSFLSMDTRAVLRARLCEPRRCECLFCKSALIAQGRVLGTRMLVICQDYIHLLKKRCPSMLPKRLHQRSFLPCAWFRAVGPGASYALCSEVTQEAPRALLLPYSL